MSDAIKKLHDYLAKSPSVVYPEDVLAYLSAIEDENAKLRKIAQDVALPLSIACDMFNIRCCECAFTKVKTCPVPELEEQLKELGIEANDG